MSLKALFPHKPAPLRGGFVLWMAVAMLSAANVQAEVVEVTMETDLGPITLELYPDKAPITVANFLRYVDAKKYDDGTFYRVVRLDNQEGSQIPIQVVQGGMLGSAMRGESSKEPEGFPPIAHETTEKTGLTHVDGAISMARQGPGTAGSEFFISIGENPPLDFGGMRNPDGQGFAVFGQVTAGMEIVRQIQGGASNTPVPESMWIIKGQLLDQPVKISKVRRTTE